MNQQQFNTWTSDHINKGYEHITKIYEHIDKLYELSASQSKHIARLTKENQILKGKVKK